MFSPAFNRIEWVTGRWPRGEALGQRKGVRDQVLFAGAKKGPKRKAKGASPAGGGFGQTASAEKVGPSAAQRLKAAMDLYDSLAAAQAKYNAAVAEAEHFAERSESEGQGERSRLQLLFELGGAGTRLTLGWLFKFGC